MYSENRQNPSHKSNKKIAFTLSFVAGIVNASGILSFDILTTNVTGHFAYFVEEIMVLEFRNSMILLFFILSFFTGAFGSNLLTEYLFSKKLKKIYYYPITIEAFLLMVVAVYSIYPNISSNAIAAMLLFTMGLQNSLVTKISKSVVRTTHLTGILTDLGIEISQLLFEKNWENTRLLKLNIQIKLIIVSSFIMGGIVGGFTYFYFELLNLIFPAILLMVTILMDYLKTK